MRYGKAFFGLQLDFAEIVSVLTGLPLARALLDYTNVYIRFGLGRDFDPSHPRWTEYLAGVLAARDRAEWTFRFYETRATAVTPPGLVAAFGCFGYARLSADRIRLHFENADTDGHSPLGKDRRDRRLADLAALFAHVKATVHEPVRLIGASWLYNLEAYRRLFPESYLATARVLPDRFRHMPLWGQFVNRHGDVRPSLAREFRERLRRQSSVDTLSQCFPFQVLSLDAPVRELYEFYGV